MRVCGGGGGCCCRAVVRAVSAPRSGVTVGSSAVGLMVTAGLCWTVAGGSISASPLLIVVVVVVVGSPPARLCRQPRSVVAGWLWGLCRSHCYCGAASAPLSSPRQAALPHGFLLAPPMFTYDQPGGRSLPHKGQSPPRTPLPLPPIPGVSDPGGPADITHPVGTKPSPFPPKSSTAPTATAGHCAPWQRAAWEPQPPPTPPAIPRGKKTRRNSIPVLLLSMHDSPPQALTAIWEHSKALCALERKDSGDGRHL